MRSANEAGATVHFDLLVHRIEVVLVLRHHLRIRRVLPIEHFDRGGFTDQRMDRAQFGRRLHRRLENYALPRRLVGRKTAQGGVPRKLAPIFRDREELPAAHDLSTEVRAALKASRSLIVVCSPSSAASQWVGREIEVFRELHPGRPILAAVRDGEPADCFPKALHGIGPDGADFRRGRDGEQLGLLKLVAGIIGLGLDELIQRDAHRRNQRVTAVTAAALAGMIVMGVLTGFALSARHEAERQRGEAEGLVEYMLTDLRDRLKGVGRLDVMTAVNERALRYYGDQDLAKLPVDSLERRARIFHAMGEDDETRGHLDTAEAKFAEARRTTAALLSTAPNDPNRIFAQAQSEFWMGSIDYDRHRVAKAKQSFMAYKSLADRLVAIDPKKAAYRQEASYADGNLCILALSRPKDPPAALRYCKGALEQMEQAAPQLRHDADFEDTIANHHAWLADAYLAAGNLMSAREERIREGEILDRALAGDPADMNLKTDWVAQQIGLAELDATEHKTSESARRLTATLTVLEKMIAHDPENKRWRDQKAWIQAELHKPN